jgi:hypothetical protein
MRGLLGRITEAVRASMPNTSAVAAGERDVSVQGDGGGPMTRAVVVDLT